MMLPCASTVHADIFGSGPNLFEIDFVSIGNPGNADDATGSPNPVGKVDYSFRMGQFEISQDMIMKANAITAAGPNPLNITYDIRSADKPATSVSWFEAAQFVNWLNTSTGSTPAYKFVGGNFQLWSPGDTGFDPNNLFRNADARYFLPSADEWYKAAYYDPTSGTYFNYSAGSNSVPAPVASGTAANTAVYLQPLNQGPADIMLAGGLSPYGTMGQGGNVWEMEETESDLLNNSTTRSRGIRGGYWIDNASELSSSQRRQLGPTREEDKIGFRVASTPEPSTLVLGLFAAAGLFMRRRNPSSST